MEKEEANKILIRMAKYFGIETGITPEGDRMENENELLHLVNVQNKVDGAYALKELEVLLPIIKRAIESGDTTELEEWAR